MVFWLMVKGKEAGRGIFAEKKVEADKGRLLASWVGLRWRKHDFGHLGPKYFCQCRNVGR